jgi:SMC interacting uncharacterized protein involved in chromosome segregation
MKIEDEIRKLEKHTKHCMVNNCTNCIFYRGKIDGLKLGQNRWKADRQRLEDEVKKMAEYYGDDEKSLHKKLAEKDKEIERLEAIRDELHNQLDEKPNSLTAEDNKKFIRFQEGLDYMGYETGRIEVHNHKKELLGYIDFQGKWKSHKQFIFIPMPETFYTIGCLVEIGLKLKEMNEALAKKEGTA